MRIKHTHQPLATTTIILLAATLACSVPGQVSEPVSEQEPEPGLIGSWEAVVGESTIGFTFETDGDFILFMEGTEIDHGQYATLDTIEPKGITLIYQDGRVIYTIYEIINSEVFWMENSLPGDPRPVLFTDAKVVFRRIRP